MESYSSYHNCFAIQLELITTSYEYISKSFQGHRQYVLMKYCSNTENTDALDRF